MSDFICADWISQAELEALLQAIQSPFDWQILEAVTQISCDRFVRVPDVAHFGTGRVFGADCELRWQRDGEAFHTVLLGNITQVPAVLARHQIALAPKDFGTEQAAYFVWGEWSGRDRRWLEAAIPHILSYPAPPDPQKHWRQQIQAIQYFSRKTQELEFYRFVSMQEVER